MQIISKIYEKGVIKLVVFDFVEANSGKRLKLSNIIESELRTIFGKAEDIVIIDSDNSQLQEPSGIERIKIAATLDMFAFTKIDSSENILAELNSFTLKNWVEDNAEIRIFENEADQKTRRTRGFKKKIKQDEPQPPIDIIGTPGVKIEKP